MKTRINIKAFLYMTPAALAILLLSSAQPVERTPFEEFRAVMGERAPYSRAETGEGGYIYTLEGGALSVTLDSGREIWRSEEEWWVDDFRLGDVDGDGTEDVLFSLWKSYRFGEAKPARMRNDDDSVRSHLFLYSVTPGFVKAIWCSSDLPRPIYEIELDPSGEVTPVSSGMLLRTGEGEYRDDFSRTEPAQYQYAWQGWGFVPVEPETHSATLSFTGDLMAHRQQLSDALRKGGGDYDFDRGLEPIRAYLSDADYTVGNLETTFPGDPALYSDYPRFGAPEEFGAAIRNAGFDLVTTANNHALDKGEDGLVHTLDVLDSLGLDHVGTYRTREERDSVFLREIGGITFAFLSYTYGTNGLPLPGGREYLVNVMNEGDARAGLFADIRAAKEANPDIIVVLPHMGEEYSPVPREEDERLVESMLRAGADVVLATHPHVIQPVGFVRVEDGGGERLCFAAYSLGNLISSQREYGADAGMILSLTFEKAPGQKARITSASYLPTWVQFAGFLGGYDIKALPVYDTLAAAENRDDYPLREEDLARLRDVLADTTRTLSGKAIDLAAIRHMPVIVDEHLRRGDREWQTSSK